MKETDFMILQFSSKQAVFTKIDLGPDRLLANNNPICSGEGYTIDAKLPASLGYTYKWYKDNVAFINNSSSFTATSPGTYKVEVQLTKLYHNRRNKNRVCSSNSLKRYITITMRC
jgi:hypothetical protein